jgi:hypothetical protein
MSTSSNNNIKIPWGAECTGEGCKGDYYHHHCITCNKLQWGEGREYVVAVYPDNQCYDCAVKELS